MTTEEICEDCLHDESCHENIRLEPTRCVYGDCKCKKFKSSDNEVYNNQEKKK